MKQKVTKLGMVLLAFLIMGCLPAVTPSPEPIASTILFADGETVSKILGSGVYTNTVSGVGGGAISYTSGTPATATVNASTGAVTLVALGTTAITANKVATATHSAVSASYILTVVQSITELAIAGVTAPATGATPVTSVIETTQYAGTINWSPAVNETFAASTVYTATIMLTAKAGYTLAGVVANSFTMAGATSVSHNANSGVVTAVYPATGDGNYASETIGTLKYVPAGTFRRDGYTIYTGTNFVFINTSTVSAFRMSQHEITRAQFLAIMGTDPSNATYSSGTDDPVQMVNWYHAIAFCNKLSISEGLTSVYAVSGVDFSTLTYAQIPTSSDEIPTSSNGVWDAATANWNANGYRLPTEMEWMWAAMGATSDRSNGYSGIGINTTGYTKGYAGSTESSYAQLSIGDYAWCIDNNEFKTKPVGTKTANELGLYDMSGNVREWTWDWSGNYPVGAQTDYRGAVSGSYRVRRGGGWSDNLQNCSVAFRHDDYPSRQSYGIGFRVVRP
jgi:formylglycine-generating enzyme required for sulfatase activity